MSKNQPEIPHQREMRDEHRDANQYYDCLKIITEWGDRAPSGISPISN